MKQGTKQGLIKILLKHFKPEVVYSIVDSLWRDKQVNTDWNITDPTNPGYIENKPNFALLDSPTFTGTVTLPKTLEIQDTSADHQYILAVSELAADRIITLPLLIGTDTFVFQSHIQTLTNKRITKRVASTTDDATAIIDCDSYDEYYLTAIANATEISVTGTPTDGQEIFIGLKDAGAAKGLTWTGITGLGLTLPTTTVAGKQHIVKIKNIASAWRAIAVNVEI